MPNTAEPSILAGVSLRSVDVPMRLNSDGNFNRTSVGAAARAASPASAPNVALRPDATCLTSDKTAVHSVAATLQRFAAAPTNIARAAAPALRNSSKCMMVESLFAVRWRLVSGLTKRSSPLGNRTWTRDQSASNSSARIFGRPSCTPCPISDCGPVIQITLSGVISRKTLNTPAAAVYPSNNPPEAAAPTATTPFTN